MDVIARARQGGKTAEAVAWVKSAPEGEHRVLLTIHEGEAQRLRRVHHVQANQVMSAHRAIDRGLVGWQNLRIGVDNIDLLGWRTVLKLGRWEPIIDMVTETR